MLLKIQLTTISFHKQIIRDLPTTHGVNYAKIYAEHSSGVYYVKEKFGRIHSEIFDIYAHIKYFNS